MPQGLKPWLHWRFKRFWVLVAALVYTLAGFFLTPWVVEKVLVGTFADTGRTATVTEIRTNPFVFTMDMTGFELQDTDDVRLLTFDRLFVDLQASSLFRWALTFKSIRLEAPHPYEERFEGADTRLVRLLSDLAATEDGAPPEDEPPPRAIIQHLEVVDARFSVIDRPAGDFEGDIGPITIVVEDVRTLPDHTGRQVVSVDVTEHDRLTWQGDLQLVPFRSSGAVEFTGADLENTRRYLDYFLPFDPDFDRFESRFRYATSLVDGELDFRVSDLAVAVEGLSLVMDAGGVPVVTLDGFQAEGGAFDLLENAARVDRIDLQGLGVRAALREDGSLSLLDLVPPMLAPSAPTDATPTPEPATGRPLSLNIGQINLAGSSADLEDRNTDPVAAVGVRDLAASVTDLDLEDGTAMPTKLSFSLASGGRLAFEGAATAFPAPEVTGRLDIEDLALAVAQPYLNPFLRVRLVDGALDLAGDLRHAPDQLLTLQGELGVTDFELHDGGRDERLAAWAQLDLDRFEANVTDLENLEVNTSILEFQGLYGRLHIAEDLSTNVGDLLVQAPSDTPSDAGGGAGLPPITVGGIRLDDAALDFSDFSLPLPFEAAIRAMDGDISTLSTVSTEPATVGLEGQVNEYGLARINGEINAWDPTQRTDITMVFRNLEIARLSPYTIQFAGYAIEEGRLDMDLGYRLNERQLQGDNSIVIREMQLGEKVDHPDAGSLPLGLAVALLKDADGVIDLDVPVEGDLDNPEFRIGGVIWKAIGNLITKVVTAPFRLLGNLVGVDSEDFGILAFQPGRSDLSPPDREKLVKLAEAMGQRPELTLEVGGSWVPDADRQALQASGAEAAIDAWLEANPGPEDELSTDRERRALEALFAQHAPAEPLETLQAEFSTPPADDPEGDPVLDEPAYLARLRERNIDAVIVTEADLQALARERAAAVIEGLRATQPEAELPVTEVDPEPAEAAEDGSVPLELGVSAGS